MFDLNRVVLTDTPLECPFAPKKKPIIPAIIGAAAAIGSAIMNSVQTNSMNNQQWDIANMNLESQKDTNRLMQELARQSNDLNYRMFNEQNAFNLDMWNKTNAYNHPKDQVQRMLAAGINPAAMFGKDYQASSLTSASSAPAVTPNMVAPQLDYHPMANDYTWMSTLVPDALDSINQIAENRKASAEADSAEAKAEFDIASLQSRLTQEFNRAEEGSIQKEQARQNLNYFNDVYQTRLMREQNETSMSDKLLTEKDLDIKAHELTNDMLSIDASIAKKMTSAQYSNLLLQNRKLLSESKNIDQDTLLKKAQELVENVRADGLKISNEQADALIDFIVEKADYEAEEANYSAGRSERLYYEGRGAEAPINKLGDAAYPSSNKRKNRTRRWHIRHYDGR